MKTLLLAIPLCFMTTLSAVAQNELSHYDGTTAFASRGVSGANEKGWLQRIPGDQAGGASQIHSHQMVLQDQDVCTAEPMQIVIYGNDGAGAPTGEPDAFGTPIAAGNVTLDGSGFCPGGFAFTFTVTWSTPIVLPFQDCAVPGNDIYVGVRAPAQPLWSADGLSMHASTTEDENVGTPGYTGAAGVPGLGWDVDFTAGTKALGTSNRAWNNRTRFVDDVVQPFASNPGVFGAEEPHFGYAGIFPDLARGDQVGVRLRSSAPVGTSSWLLVSASSAPASTNALSNGVLCLGGFIVIVGPVSTIAPGGQATSESVFGPFAVPSGIAPGAVAYVQGLTFPGPLFNLSTLASIHLP